MPRKKKTVLAGTDPEYTSDFSQPLPTNKVVAPASADPNPKPAQAPEPAAQEKQTTPEDPPKKAAPKARAKPAAKPTPAKTQSEPKRATEPKPADKREIAVAAAVKVDQDAKLRALAKKGVTPKDVITLAGRRAVDQFEPKQQFIPKPDAERMPMREGYKSTKRVSAALLDTLRDEHDPLRLSSDGAMLRGQFEPLFWDVLDEVITELSERFK